MSGLVNVTIVSTPLSPLPFILLGVALLVLFAGAWCVDLGPRTRKAGLLLVVASALFTVAGGLELHDGIEMKDLSGTVGVQAQVGGGTTLVGFKDSTVQAYTDRAVTEADRGATLTLTHCTQTQNPGTWNCR